MGPQEFEAALQAGHYGEITLVVDGMPHTYGVSDIFRLPAGTVHTEHAVPTGHELPGGAQAASLTRTQFA